MSDDDDFETGRDALGRFKTAQDSYNQRLGHLTDAEEGFKGLAGSSRGQMRWRWYSLTWCGSCDLK
jgi:hypothetical protein